MTQGFGMRHLICDPYISEERKAAFGVVTSYFFTVLGVVLIARGLAGWIEDIRHEH